MQHSPNRALYIEGRSEVTTYTLTVERRGYLGWGSDVEHFESLDKDALAAMAERFFNANLREHGYEQAVRKEHRRLRATISDDRGILTIVERGAPTDRSAATNLIGYAR